MSISSCVVSLQCTYVHFDSFYNKDIMILNFADKWVFTRILITFQLIGKAPLTKDVILSSLFALNTRTFLFSTNSSCVNELNALPRPSTELAELIALLEAPPDDELHARSSTRSHSGKKTSSSAFVYITFLSSFGDTSNREIIT